MTAEAVAAAIGCEGFAASAEPAPGIATWGTCTIDGVKTWVFYATDVDAYFTATEGFGVTRENVAVAGPIIVAPDSPELLPGLRATIAKLV